MRSWSHPNVLSEYTTMVMTDVHLCPLNVSPWPWSKRTWVLINVFLNYKLSFVYQYEVVILHWCTTVQIHYNDDDGMTVVCLCYVGWMYGTVSCWSWTNRKYVSIGVCLHLQLLFVLDSVRGRSNITPKCCPNTLQCPYTYVRWLYVMMPCWPWTYRKWVFIGMLEFDYLWSIQ